MTSKGQRSRRVPLSLWRLLAGVLAVGMGGAGTPSARAAASIGAIGSAVSPAGDTVTLPLTVTRAVTNVAGLDLTLSVKAESGAPPLTPAFSPGAQTGDWLISADPRNVWHVTLANGTGVKGPAELVKVSLQVSAAALPGTVYTLEASPAILGGESGQERDISAVLAAGRVTVPVVYGDLTRDRQVDARDLSALLQLFLGLRQPTEAEVMAGDTRPKPGTGGRPFGDGLLQADDLNWLLRRFLGLEIGP